MIHYSAAGLAVVTAASERAVGRAAWRLLLRVALAVLLGAGLAAFYLIPASHEQGWINLSEVMAPGVRPQDNFLFTTIDDPDHNRFNFLVSTIALSEIALLAAAMWLARQKNVAATGAPSEPGSATPRSRWLWLLLSGWGTASALLMVSVSNLLWVHLPKFRFVQLPFRWLLCMNAALAILVTMAVKRWRARLFVSVALLAIVLLASHRYQPPWWDQGSDIREMSDAIADGIGYEGTDEYVPIGADPYELDKTLPRVSTPVIDGECLTTVRTEMLSWGQLEKHFVAHTTGPENLVVRLFNYPAWAVMVNGKPTETRTTAVTGLIVVPVGAGDSDIQISFRRTGDRKIGTAISLLSLLIFIVAWRQPAWVRLQRPQDQTTVESSAA
jgi:hypothetical protein